MQNAQELDAFLRLPQVIEITTIKKTKLYELMKDGFFPKNIKIHGRTSVWRKSEVRQWMSAPDTYNTNTATCQ